jgi:hypothetical protein
MNAALMTVTVPLLCCGTGKPQVCECVIAAACPVCGRPRGEPEPILEFCCGHYRCIDTWINLCGHIDTYTNVLLEVALQCANPTCLAGWTVEDYPYCGIGCAGADLLGRAAKACHGVR